MSITPQAALQRVIEHREIFHDEMVALMRAIMQGEVSPVMTAALLTGLRVKKESVGEIAAYAIAGVISADEAVSLAATRGAEMAKACALEPTGMSALLGGDEAEVLARLEALDLVPANRNAAGQIVAAGALAALEKLAEDPPARARVRKLATAGAFHTQYMASALPGYTTVADRINPAEPGVTLLSNADGRPVSSAADAMAKLVAQLTRPVRWDLCTETLRERGVTAVVEFPPAGALSGIAKRELRGVANHAVKSPADLDGLAEALRNPAS